MAREYRRVDRDQLFLLPVDMGEWLPQDHLVWFIIAAVEQMDTGAFHAKAKLGGVGRRGYDPEMLLTLFIYAMAHGESSSRKIERLCRTDVAFRIICAQDVPDHTVLARFRQQHEAALTSILTESLVLAAQLGMVSLGVVALDGTKIGANASKDANRTEEGLRKLAQEYVHTGQATDAAEDALFGADSGGDELPEAVADRTDRPGRIQRALDEIAARRAQAEEARKHSDERVAQYERDIANGVPRPGQMLRGADKVMVAKVRWERAHAKAAARYAQYRHDRARGVPKPGRPLLPPEEHLVVRRAKQAYDKAKAEADQRHQDGAPTQDSADEKTKDSEQQFRANLTDPDSRLLPSRNGWVQGMNCQTSTSADVFILSARATQDANDMGQFIPTTDALQEAMGQVAARTGRDDLARVGTVLADAGYDSEENLTAPGPKRLIANSKGYRIASRAAQEPAAGPPPEGASAREAMNHRLRTPEGLRMYRRRSHMIEAPNAWLKDGRGLRHFSRRGLKAAQAELSFAAGVTNLLRIATKGVSAARLKMA